jgi:hypothetical protein
VSIDKYRYLPLATAYTLSKSNPEYPPPYTCADNSLHNVVATLRAIVIALSVAGIDVFSSDKAGDVRLH